MFKLFKSKSKVDKLQIRYEKLLEESYKLSRTDRAAADKKQVEAQDLLNEIEKLESQ